MQLRHLRTVVPAADAPNKVVALCWSPNSSRFAVATADRVISLFDENGEQRKDKFSTKPVRRRWRRAGLWRRRESRAPRLFARARMRTHARARSLTLHLHHLSLPAGGPGAQGVRHHGPRVVARLDKARRRAVGQHRLRVQGARRACAHKRTHDAA
jgi:hypothetical protein